MTHLFTTTRFFVVLALIWNTAWAQAHSFP
ncbi:MAG: hypothetical protein RL541_1670, partial [Pseudomonadota bacterium]